MHVSVSSAISPSRSLLPLHALSPAVNAVPCECRSVPEWREEGGVSSGEYAFPLFRDFSLSPTPNFACLHSFLLPLTLARCGCACVERDGLSVLFRAMPQCSPQISHSVLFFFEGVCRSAFTR